MSAPIAPPTTGQRIIEAASWVLTVVLFLFVLALAVIGIWTGETRFLWIALTSVAPLVIALVASAALTGIRQQRQRANP